MYSDTRVYLHDEYETFYSRENSLELSWPRAFTNDHWEKKINKGQNYQTYTGNRQNRAICISYGTFRKIKKNVTIFQTTIHVYYMFWY